VFVSRYLCFPYPVHFPLLATLDRVIQYMKAFMSYIDIGIQEVNHPCRTELELVPLSPGNLCLRIVNTLRDKR